MAKKIDITIEELLSNAQLLNVMEKLSIEYECIDITKEQLLDCMKNMVRENISMCSSFLHVTMFPFFKNCLYFI